MSLLSLQLAVSLLILVITFVGGWFPIKARVSQNTIRWLAYGETFASGVFLGAGFMHLLPSAEAHYRAISQSSFPFVFLVCVLSILFLRIIENVANNLIALSCQLRTTWLCYFLTIVLSIHAVMEGVALGVQTEIADFMILVIAIAAHKGAESFALGMNMKKNNLASRQMLGMLWLFTFMTPLGIGCGSGISAVLVIHPSLWIQSLFEAIAAGTFIYVGIFQSSPVNDKNESPKSALLRLMSFVLGLSLMTALALIV